MAGVVETARNTSGRNPRCVRRPETGAARAAVLPRSYRPALFVARRIRAPTAATNRTDHHRPSAHAFDFVEKSNPLRHSAHPVSRQLRPPVHLGPARSALLVAVPGAV